MEQASAKSQTGWGDLLGEGRLPQFALICLGVWLIAADSLVVATIMPSVGADLGGYAYFSWSVAGFLMGGILAGASAGRLSEIFGLRPATAFSGALFAAGCALSAAAPDMLLFLVGRVLQGIGGGWIMGFAMVAIAFIFPERHLARVFASVSGVWGVATVLGPLVGGLFAEAGDWRSVFWLFAAQALVFAVAAPFLLKGSAGPQGGSGIPWLQLGVLGLAVGAIGLADVVSRNPAWAVMLVAAGLACLILMLRIDDRARVRLLPHRSGDLRTICGAAYATQFALTAASMGLFVYGPSILQTTVGLSPLMAGYVVGTEALTWTLAAIVVASAGDEHERRWIRLGAACVLTGVVLLMLVMGSGNVPLIVLAAAIMGSGFGFCSSLLSRRVMAAVSEEDRAIGSSAIIAVRQIGGATGAAMAGVAANLVGFGAGPAAATAESAGFWIFAGALPLALAGTWAAWRLTGSAVRA